MPHAEPTYQAAEIEISSIKLGTRFRKHPEEGIESLAKSIEHLGLLHPPVVTEDSSLLVVGQRRVEAFRFLGRTKIPVRLVRNLEDGILLAHRDENVERIKLRPSEVAALAKVIEPKLKAEAKERQKEGGRRKTKQHDSSRGGKRRPTAKDLVAQEAGMSRKTMGKAEEVVDSGRSDLIEEMDKTGKVDAPHKKLKARGPQDLRVSALDKAAQGLISQVREVLDFLEKGGKASPIPIEGLAARLVEIGRLGEALMAKGQRLRTEAKVTGRSSFLRYFKEEGSPVAQP